MYPDAARTFWACTAIGCTYEFSELNRANAIKPGGKQRNKSGRHSWQGPNQFFPWSHCACCMHVRNKGNTTATTCKGPGRLRLLRPGALHHDG